MAELAIEIRTETGKGPARRARAAGKVPGVVYGQGSEPVGFTVDPKTFLAALTERGETTLLTLKASGSKLDGKVALLQDYQRDPVTRDLLHIDLLEVDMSREVTVEVPVHLTGKAKGTVEGGVVDHIRHILNVRCLPGSIPKEIVVDITELDIGDAIHVRDLQLPEGVKAVGDGAFTIVTVVAPAAEEPEPVAAAPVEGAAAAPAEGAAAAAPAEGEKKKE